MATGDSRLTNQARLLAAQELNRRILAEKAAKKLAEIEEERKKEAEKRFQRQRDLLAKQTAGKSAQVKAFQEKRLADDIAKQKATAKEKARISALNKQAQAKKQKAVQRVVAGTGTNIELTSGRKVIKRKGKIVGLSNQESASSIKAKQTIVREIQRRETERTKVTDLERFLENEQRLASGQVSRAELNKQIADRKKRGLSKTPQQKALDAKLRGQETGRALASRAQGKIGRFARAGEEGFSATPEALRKENERSRAKSSQNFGNVQNQGFISVRGAGASFQARAKDSSLGQIESQLAHLRKKRTSKSRSQSQNERVASQIASGNFFSNLSSFDLGNILSGGQGKNVRKAPSAKASVGAQARRQAGSNKEAGDQAINLNRFNPFAVVAQQDIPDPVTGITDRQVQLFREDIKRSNKGKSADDQERVPDTSEFFSSGRAPRADDPFNDFEFGNFGGVDTTKLDVEGGDIANPNAVDFSLLEGRGAFFSDTQTQADIESARKEAKGSGIGQSFLVGELPQGVKAVDKDRQAKRERGLRAQGFSLEGVSADQFRVSGTDVVAPNRVKPKKLKQSSTQQFGSLNLPPAESQRQANQGIPFTPSFPQIPQAFAEVSKPATQTKKQPKTTTPSNQTNAFGGQQIDLTFGQGAKINQTVRSGVGAVQDVIDSPFGQFGSQAIRGAIANPRETIQKGQDAFGTFSNLFSQTNFFDPTSPARNVQVKGVSNKAINDDAFRFLSGN